MIVLILLGWIVCGAIGYGLYLGEFTREFLYMKHTGAFGSFVFLCGPFGILAATISSIVHNGKLTFRLKSLTKEERWNEFVKIGFGILGRERFERDHG